MKETRNLLWKQMSAWLSRCPPGFQSPASCEGEAYHREKKVRERWEERGKMSRAQGETVQNRLRRKRETKGREGTPGSGEGRVTGCLLCRSAGRRVIRTGTKSCNIRAPPGGPVMNNSPANAGDKGSIPCLRRFYMPQGN